MISEVHKGGVLSIVLREDALQFKLKQEVAAGIEPANSGFAIHRVSRFAIPPNKVVVYKSQQKKADHEVSF